MSNNVPTQNQVKVKKQLRTKNNMMFFIKRDFALYLMFFIPLCFLLVFYYAPMYGLIIAFKDYDVTRAFSESAWIGLDAFKEVFHSSDFYQVLRNTIVLNFLDLIVGFPTPIILAILLNEVRCKWFKKISQTIMYLPHFLSWIIIAGISYQLLSPSTGLMNILIRHLGGQSVPFLTEKWHWLATYNVIGVWQTAGWGTIIYLAAITGINSELYEAAGIDGAGRLKKIWHISLPGIRSTIIVMLIITLGRILGIGLERPYAIGNPIVREFSDVISTYVYRVGIQSLRFNIGTAVGLFQSIVGLILVLITDSIAKKFGEDGIL
ncbi:ABC transporter permease [Clostridium lacusfryxellense]|uniref:ABC transporter permease n=1 Tax=Clostridium lacusfryxellense TaxID=205328 RepID=UPI001FE47249|nr:ABC transporter permease subunit [Clostridium lacusfryxellense]